MMTMSSDNLHALCSNLSKEINYMPWCYITRIKSLQRFVKRLQEKGHFEIGSNFNYSSIDEDDFLNFTHDPSHRLSDGEHPRPVFASFSSKKLLDCLEFMSLERSGSSFPINRKPTSSSRGAKGSTSSTRSSIDVSIASEEEAF